MNQLKRMIAACLVAAALSNLYAKVELPAFFSDGMVMQQQTQANLWGTATAGKTVKVITGWDGAQYSTPAGKDGKWKLSFRTPPAGGPYTITLDNGEVTRLENILVGEL